MAELHFYKKSKALRITDEAHALLATKADDYNISQKEIASEAILMLHKRDERQRRLLADVARLEKKVKDTYYFAHRSDAMIIKEIADILDGMEYGQDLPAAEAVLNAKRNGIVIVFGASVDLMEFRGAIEDEVGCFEGGTAYLDKNGLIVNKCDNEDCPYFREKLQHARTITAIWGSEGYSWIFKTDIPHETFEILEEGGEKYCRGIVFLMENLE